MDWVAIYEKAPDFLPLKIAEAFDIDSRLTGFDSDEWEVSMPEFAFVLCIRNLVQFCVKFGFTNSEIDDAIRLTVELYGYLVSSWDASNVINETGIFLSVVKGRNSMFASNKLVSLIEHLQRDLMQHLSLYRFCAFGERYNDAKSFTLTVNTPPNYESFLPLRTGIRKEIREYEEKLKEIEETEIKEKTEKYEEQIIRELDIEQNSETLVSGKMAEWNLIESPQYKNVLDIINTVAREYSAILSNRLADLIDNMELDLKYKVAKTSLPRPTKLGPPPRFKPKAPVQTKAPTTTTVPAAAANNAAANNVKK